MTAETQPTTETKPASATMVPAPAKSSITVRVGAMGLMPTTVDEMWKLAQLAAGSDIVPKDFRAKPHNVLIAMEHGLECGVPWMQAIQNTAIINGRPGFFGDLFLAVIMNSDVYLKHVEYYLVKGEKRSGLLPEDWKHDDTCAVCTFWRRGQDEPTTRQFSVADAKLANLLKKPGPWTEYPSRQLQMRARGFAGRDCFPDVLKGMSRPAEELRDLPPEPESLPTVEPAREIRRISDTQSPSPDRRNLHDFTDREPATRGDGPSVPPAEHVIVGPLKVKNVEPFLGLFTITLADGTQIDTTEAADAMVLEQVKDTEQAIRFTCRRSDDGNLHLVSFVSAD
jgi:hypothetical protein